MQDMHYAEFTENEGSFVRLTHSRSGTKSSANGSAGYRFASRHQGVRGQQVEGDWPESGQAGKGQSLPIVVRSSDSSLDKC